MTDDPGPRCLRALVIYEHGLLGEGVAAQLRAEDVDTTVVPAADLAAVEAALGDQPCLVVAERATPECHARVRALSPGARVIDISQVVSRGVADAGPVVDFQMIRDAVGAARAEAGPAQL